MKSNWRHKAVVYQIYPRSFCDSNGDGIGDINGITGKLGYLKELGVDVLWLSPVYESPMRDNGYDISDYCAINPEFGTMADFDNLLEQAHTMGLKIVMDLVVNHSSNKHPWFIESRQSRENPKRDYYIWRDGKNGKPPNNWKAYFGGSAWTLDEKTGQYYLHCFSPFQPDLNWTSPALRAEIYRIMRWWLDKGIDGFRMGAISLIDKPQDFPDGDLKSCVLNRPKVHDFLQEMRMVVLDQYDILTVGETGGVTPDDALLYAALDGSELDMIFQFEHMNLDGGETFKSTDTKISLVPLKQTMSRWQNELHGRAWNSLCWCRCDQMRMVSRLGDEGKFRDKSAKMLAACLFFMQGTPYIYQGEEVGMTNAPFSQLSDSVFAFYKTLIQLRKRSEIITEGAYTLLLEQDPELFVYIRTWKNEALLVMCNFSPNERTVELPQRFLEADLILSNGEEGSPEEEAVNGKAVLGPFGAQVYY